MNIKDLKKVELHLHLDGSVRPSTLAEIKNISLDEAKELLIAKDKCRDLNDYLKKFSEPVSIMQSKEGLERITRELCEDLISDNIIYAEIRFAPNLHTSYLSLDDVILSVLKGARSTNLKCNFILCMMRGDSYFNNRNIVDLAKKYLGKGVCAIDLAGAEGIYKTSEYEELFSYASSLSIPFTIHAGEADGPDSINSALDFGAKRIGHGVRCLENMDTVKRLKDNEILLEVCPTSNVQTNIVSEYKDHPIKRLIDNSLKVSINTDNRTVSNVSISDEYQKLVDNFNFTKEIFDELNINAIKSSFISENDKEELINIIKK